MRFAAEAIMKMAGRVNQTHLLINTATAPERPTHRDRARIKWSALNTSHGTARRLLINGGTG